MKKAKKDKRYIKGSIEAKVKMQKVRNKKNNFLFKSWQDEEKNGL